MNSGIFHVNLCPVKLSDIPHLPHLVVVVPDFTWWALSHAGYGIPIGIVHMAMECYGSIPFEPWFFLGMNIALNTSVFLMFAKGAGFQLIAFFSKFPDVLDFLSMLVASVLTVVNSDKIIEARPCSSLPPKSSQTEHPSFCHETGKGVCRYPSFLILHVSRLVG